MSKLTDFFQKVSENVIFVLVFLTVVVAMFLIAYVAEKLIQKKNGTRGKIFNTRKTAMIGMFSAISMVLMFFEFPLPFLAPPFYELDPSEIPILICGFAFGPVAAVIAEFCKILLKLMFRSTSTAFVGELANFAIGCSLILPATIIYHIKKKKSVAIIGCVIGTICMTVFGTAFNAIYLLPTFSVLYGMPLDIIIGMGTKINSSITDLTSFVVFAVAPINLIKGTGVTILTMLMYKPLSPILKDGHKK